MGQTMGGTLATWESLMNERERVLHWSSEVLARVQDNVTNEDTFLIDYDDDKVNCKIETWIKTNRAKVDEVLHKYPNGNGNAVLFEIEQLIIELRTKVWKDYQSAYNNIDKFNKKVDRLGVNERKIHAEILKLEEKYAKDVRKFRKELVQLRTKVFNNLRTSEKMMFRDKRLKNYFIKKIYEIDRKSSADYTKRVMKLLQNFEKNTTR